MLIYKELSTSLSDVMLKEWHPDFDITRYYIKKYSYEETFSIFEKSFLLKLNEFSKIKNMMIFCRSKIGGIHTDISEHMGLNFILSLKDSALADGGKMQWFTPKQELKKVTYSEADTPIVRYTDDDVELLTEVNTSDKLILVKTDIPHRAIPYDGSHRICFSFRFEDNNLTVDSAVNRLLQLGL